MTQFIKSVFESYGWFLFFFLNVSDLVLCLMLFNLKNVPSERQTVAQWLPHSSWVHKFPPTCQSLGYTKMPLERNECVNVCAWCPVTDWCLIEGVLLPHPQRSRDKLQIHQDKPVPEDD